jgi:ABC-type glutathione transport system ATPase component
MSAEADGRLVMNDIEVRFRTAGRGADVVACNHLDVTVPRGEIVALVGESGSGKTTLGRVMVGLQRFSAGTVDIDGVIRGGRRPRAGYDGAVQMVFQSPGASLNPRMTLRAILSYAARRGGTPERAVKEAVVRALAETGIAPAESYLDRYVHQLSGGQQQRVALARALLYRPRYLVADEPTSALDVSVRAQIVTLIREICERHRMGILFITHDLAVVRALADSVVVMYRGDIVERGRTLQIFADPQHEYTRTLLASTPELVPPGASADRSSVPLP